MQKVARLTTTGISLPRVICLAATALVGLAQSRAALADPDRYASGVTHTHSCTTTTSKVTTYFDTHPKVRKATIGAGVGTATGAAVGLISGKGIVRGAAIGAGTGATVGAIRGSQTMQTHPYMKDMASGTLSGAGLGLAMNRGHNTGKRAAEGAALGAMVGLGAGWVKKEFH
jgi:hypothetical protein